MAHVTLIIAVFLLGQLISHQNHINAARIVGQRTEYVAHRRQIQFIGILKEYGILEGRFIFVR